MPTAVIERARQTMDKRRFNALFGGQWERMAGLVYDCFDEIENVCEPMSLPGAKFYGGIDWGFTEPFVFLIRAVMPNGMQYQVAEMYRSNLTISDIADAVLRLVITWNVEHIYCGQDQPASIEELNRRFRKQNVRCGASGANNSVRLGIDRHYEMLKLRKLKYFAGSSPHTLNEYDTYHYPEPKDLKPDQDSKECGPVQQDDHAMDASRYLSISLYSDVKTRKPAISGEGKRDDHYKEWERLKKGPRYADV